jgi:hypothetical protein
MDLDSIEMDLGAGDERSKEIEGFSFVFREA